MNRVCRHLVAGFGIAATVAINASACSHNDQSIFVRGVMAPPAAAGGAGCSYIADPTKPMISSGLLDVAFTTSYQMVILIGNQLIERGNVEQVRAETSRVILKGAIVRILDASGRELRAYTRLSSGVADQAAGTTPQYGIIGIEAMDPTSVRAAAEGITPLVETRRRVISVKVFGTTLGGQDVESNEFQFPVDICQGCLVAFPADSQDNAIAKPNCAGALTSGGSGGLATPCFYGQDQPIDCRTCVGAAPEFCDPKSRI